MSSVLRSAHALAFGVMMLMTGTVTLSAQDTSANPDFSSSMPHIGIPVDWSTQRVIYTRNGSVEDMMKVRNDPRFLNSFLLHNARENANQNQVANPSLNSELNNAGTDAGLIDTEVINDELTGSSTGAEMIGSRPRDPGTEPIRFPAPRRRNKNTKVDWAVSLGPTFGMAIGESPAKYSFDPSAKPTCTTTTPPSIGDFIVYSLKAPPKVGTQANLVGLTNLYSGTAPTGFCGTAPTFLFSYAIGSGGSLLSPVLSLDGKKVAWIENSSAGHAILHITTWANGQGTDATAGSVAIGNCSSLNPSCDVAIDYTNSAYSGCTASAKINTNSELYVDYTNDAGYIGADNGILYHLTGVFKGTPTFDFCIPVNTSAGTALSGGVYDPLLSPPELFIADSKKLYAYTVGATSFTLKTTVTYGNGTLTGPGPILDAFNNFIYLFSAGDVATPSHTSVTQMPTTLATSVVVPLGPASTNAYPILFYGTFDNTYFTFGPKHAGSTLYSCGTDSTTTTAQDLFAISFNAGTGLMNTTPAMPANKNVNPGGLNGTCSPISELYDGTKDRIFVGMGQHVATSGANVVQMWDVTTQLTSAATTPTASATNYLGGPTGLVVDNNANTTNFPQAESVYFSTIVCATPNGVTPACGNGNCCAVKLTQSGLQ